MGFLIPCDNVMTTWCSRIVLIENLILISQILLVMDCFLATHTWVYLLCFVFALYVVLDHDFAPKIFRYN